MIPLAPQAEGSTPERHRIAPGGAQADAWLFRAAEPMAPCAVVFPALGTPARPYRRLGETLSGLGVHCLLADWRGLDSSAVRARRGVDWGYLDLVDGEAEAMLGLARRELPQSPVHAVGHSLGGHVALMHAARHPERRVASVILASSASPHHRGYPPPFSLGVYGFAWLALGMSSTLGVFRGDWLRFGERQGARLMREWSRFARSGRLDALGEEGWNADAAMRSVSLPLLAIAMGGDRFAPEPAVRRLAAKITGDHRFERLDRLPDGKAPGHFAWMRQPQPLAMRIAERLKSVR